MPPSPWIGSTRMPPVWPGDRVAHLVQVAERHLVEAVDRRPEALEVLGVAGGGDGRQGAAVEGALEGDHAVALGLAGIDIVRRTA